MKLFVDTANVDEIRQANDMGVICGVTTNPSLIAKEGRDFVEVVKEITTIVDLSVPKLFPLRLIKWLKRLNLLQLSTRTLL